MVVAACTGPEAGYAGDLRLFFSGQEVGDPVRSVSNQDFQAWRFYEQPFFDPSGQTRQVIAGQAVRDLGFDA